MSKFLRYLMESKAPDSKRSSLESPAGSDGELAGSRFFRSKFLGGGFPRLSFTSDALRSLRYLTRWTPLAICAGALAGTASAVLIQSLAWATDLRNRHHWLIAFLPVAGMLVSLLYQYVGRNVEAGNNLILDEVHDPRQRLPIRMTPLILFATFVTHLFGGSVGREGTALQTGASLADQLTRPFGLNPRERRILLMTGVSAGFGSVFGTPLAGSLFGLEVLAIGSVSYDALVPCVLGAFVGDLVTRAWGITHEVSRIAQMPEMDAPGFHAAKVHAAGLLWAVVAGTVFGLAARAFAYATHKVSAWFKRGIPWPPLRPFVGGTLVALGVWACGTTKYIGLGLPGLAAAFQGPQPAYDWLGKFAFTVVTLGAGFKGGEVTPLFFIGATLGNALSHILPLSPSLLAGMGFAAVFAGAANTPIASTLMALELFGAEAGAYAGIACVLSYLFSGESGIYESQRKNESKYGERAELTLAERAKEYLGEDTPPDAPQEQSFRPTV